MILIIFDFGSLSEQSSKNINTNYRWTAMIIPYMTTALAISTNVGEDALIALVAIILLAFLFYSIKIVREYQRIVVFRFGRALAQKVAEGTDEWNKDRTDKCDPIREADCIFCNACVTACPVSAISVAMRK